jgi:hypothetical protein
LEKAKINRTSVNVYYCTKDKIDVRHVDRIKDVYNVNVFGFNNGGHGVIRTLKDKGILEDLLQASLLDDGSGYSVTQATVRKLNIQYVLYTPFRVIGSKLRQIAKVVTKN